MAVSAFAQAFARQLAMPRGLPGRALGAAMDLANRRPTRLAIDKLAPSAGENILDAGCGTGAAMAALLQRADCTLSGIDRSDAMIAAASRRLGPRATLRRSEIEQLPFDDAAFDGVLALNVLYFCDVEARMVASLRRVLRPGGRLVAYVTDRATMARWPFTEAGMHRLFDEAELIELLVAGGFVSANIRISPVQLTSAVTGLLVVARREAERER